MASERRSTDEVLAEIDSVLAEYEAATDQTASDSLTKLITAIRRAPDMTLEPDPISNQSIKK